MQQTSYEAIAVSDSIKRVAEGTSGSEGVSARVERPAGEVTLDFGERNVTSVSAIVNAVEGLLGGDKDKARFELQGDALVARVPAQTYVDKLGGDVSGYKPSQQAEKGETPRFPVADVTDISPPSLRGQGNGRSPRTISG